MKAAALLLLLPLASHAEDWMEVDNPVGPDRYYYHAGKIVINGDDVTYWKKVEFKVAPRIKNKPARTALYRERLNCAEHTLKTLDYLFYAADNTTLELVSQNDPQSQPVIPDTIGDLFERALCPLVEQHRKEEKEKGEVPDIIKKDS
jgi:hypothetical protein